VPAKRKSHGHSLIETVVAIGILSVVVGLLYSYERQGWKLHGTSLNFGFVQSTARSAMEQMAINIRQASKDRIYVGSGFNVSVPFPQDANTNQPYIYFARPFFDDKFKAKHEVKSKIQKVLSTDRDTDDGRTANGYDYYLYYVANTKLKENEIYTENRGQIKLYLIRGQSKFYTEENKEPWPFLPYEMVIGKFDDIDSMKVGVGSEIKTSDVGPIFDLHETSLHFGYTQSNPELFSIHVNMYDPYTKAKSEFQTAIHPRN